MLSRGFSVFAFESLLIGASLQLFDRNASPHQISLLLLASVVPVILAAPLTGHLVDHVDRRLLLVLASGVAIATALLLGLQTAAVFSVVLMAVIAVAHSVISSSWQASFPQLVSEDDLTSAIGLSQTTNTLANSAAPAVVGILIGSSGTAGLVGLVCACYLPVALLACFRTPLTAPTEGPTPLTGHAGRPVETRAGALAGLRYLRRDPIAWRLLAILATFAIFVGATNVVEVFLLRGHLHATSTQFGIAAAAWATGVVVGARCAAWAQGPDRVLVVAAIGALVACVSSVAIGLAPTIWWAAAAMLVGGTGNGLLVVAVGAAVMSRSPASIRGRVATALSAVANTAIVLSYLGGGMIAAVLDARQIYVSAGICSGLLVSVLMVGMLPRARRSAAARELAEPKIKAGHEPAEAERPHAGVTSPASGARATN